MSTARDLDGPRACGLGITLDRREFLADVAWSDPGRGVSDQPVEDVTLIPYGCTNIRITEFPKVRSGG